MSKVGFRIFSVIASLSLMGFGGVANAMKLNGNNYELEPGWDRASRGSDDSIPSCVSVYQFPGSAESALNHLNHFVNGNLNFEKRSEIIWEAEFLLSFLRLNFFNESAENIKKTLEKNKEFMIKTSCGNNIENQFCKRVDKIDVSIEDPHSINLKFYPYKNNARVDFVEIHGSGNVVEGNKIIWDFCIMGINS